MSTIHSSESGIQAVQAARDAARALQCRNNLKQIGLAVQLYTAAWDSLPPGSIHSGTTTAPQFAHTNWAIAILPHLEQQALRRGRRRRGRSLPRRRRRGQGIFPRGADRE